MGTTPDAPSKPSQLAASLPDGFPSCLRLGRKSQCLRPTAQKHGKFIAYRNGRPTKPAASLTYLQRTYQGKDTEGRHEPAVQTCSADHEHRWSKSPGTKGGKFHTEKLPCYKKAHSNRCLFRDATPAILENQSPCQETEIQASSSKEGSYPEKTECELSPSSEKSEAASSGASFFTATSFPTSFSSWSHNTLASSPDTSVEESSPEQKEQGSSSPLVTDYTGTPEKAALSTPQT
ncbi:hypothetical protein MRX96_049816 [Rhipicephalus microplus]